ncbi:MAG: aminoacyl-tRNA hydrolase [Pseudomonadota bacterium]|nr:aminoacyl-tRNA hydrolase [Pseudomonadota bacterium]
MLLFAGLGNPGAQYVRNRHNIGFMAVDEVVRRHGFGSWRRKFQGEIAEGILEGVKVLAVKPLTFMNDSGRCVGQAMRFYGIEPGDLYAFHDEIDLVAGKVRVKLGGGTAGHNGLRSLDAHIGNGFRRVRIGIGHPGEKERVHGHVLGDFSKADASWVDPLLAAIGEHVPLLARHEDGRFQNKVHLALNPAEKNAPPQPAEKV